MHAHKQGGHSRHHDHSGHGHGPHGHRGHGPARHRGGSRGDGYQRGVHGRHGHLNPGAPAARAGAPAAGEAALLSPAAAVTTLELPLTERCPRSGGSAACSGECRTCAYRGT
jgi:hypothetical protein